MSEWEHVRVCVKEHAYHQHTMQIICIYVLQVEPWWAIKQCKSRVVSTNKDIAIANIAYVTKLISKMGKESRTWLGLVNFNNTK